MGGSSSKGRVEIDVKRQAWVRTRPNPAHPKHHGRNRAQSVAGVRPQINRRQQNYDVPPSYDQQEPERPIRGYGDEGRSRYDDRGLSRAQSSRSQGRSRRPFAEDVFDDEAGGVPTRGHRDEGPAHHNSRGLSRGQYDDRGTSRVQRNPDQGHRGQQGYDSAPLAELTDEYAVVSSQRASHHDRERGNHPGSHRGRQQSNQGRQSRSLRLDPFIEDE